MPRNLRIKRTEMKNYNRDLLLLYRTDDYNEDLLQHEVECLHQLLRGVENNDCFCQAHELVKRSKITSRHSAILDAASHPSLKPFYFLINKN